MRIVKFRKPSDCMMVLKGFINFYSSSLRNVFFLSVLITILSFSDSRAQAVYTSNTSVILQDYLKRHSHEVPPKSTIERVKKYDELIQYFCSLNFSRPGIRVNPNFMRALMSAESAGDKFALSHKNAYGLTQITPAMGKIAARKLYEMKYNFKYVDEEKLKDLKPGDLFDPAINILISTYLIDKYNSDYGDNLALTISAWNAGPGAVKRYKGYPPYDETLTLIARVNYYYLHYQKQYFWY